MITTILSSIKRGSNFLTLFDAGLTNGKAAIDYVLENFNQIDSERIYSTGHSSGATISLMMAAHDSRLRGAIAYAPGPSIKDHFGSGALTFLTLFYGLDRDFNKKYSPLNNVKKLTCPIFLFQAKDDTITPYENMEKFYKALNKHNKSVTLKVVDEGGHYNSMLYEGIPAGIEWILEDR